MPKQQPAMRARVRNPIVWVAPDPWDRARHQHKHADPETEAAHAAGLLTPIFCGVVCAVIFGFVVAAFAPSAGGFIAGAASVVAVALYLTHREARDDDPPAPPPAPPTSA